MFPYPGEIWPPLEPFPDLRIQVIQPLYIRKQVCVEQSAIPMNDDDNQPIRDSDGNIIHGNLF
jgi:hypothetical protein